MDKSLNVNKNTISSIDIAKFIFCCCIIALHSGFFSVLPPDAYYYVKKLLLRSGVPFFFVVSGYFLGLKINRTADYDACIFSYCKRLLLPLVVFSLINYVEIDINMILKGKSIAQIILSNLRTSLFYPPGALWFVWACIIGSLLLLPFLKNNLLKLALFIGGILYTWSLVCNNYYFLVEGTRMQSIVDGYLHLFISPRNGFFLGFFMLAIGVYCSRIVVPQKLSNLFLLISVILLIIEVTLLKNKSFADEGSLYISQIIFIPFLLLSILNIKSNIPYGLSITLRKLSVGMYYLHKPVLFLVCLFSENVVLTFVITISISVSICLLSYKHKHLGIDRILS